MKLSGGQSAGEERGQCSLLSLGQTTRRCESVAHHLARSPYPPGLLQTLTREQILSGDPEAVFGFFADAFNLEVITPPWLRFGVVTPGPVPMGPGTMIEYRLRLHRIPIRWLTRIEVWEPGRRFVDVQVRGPYRTWRHTHSFEPHADGTLVRDTVHYDLPLGPLGRLAHAAFVRSDLERIFDFRREEVARRLGAGTRGEANWSTTS
jgi:ligand-binding SRPBCC domain-containing protein